MSLIHEALQKAEAERRAGELPPLLSVTVPVVRRRPSYLPLVAACVGLALVAAAGYSNRGLIMQTLGMARPAATPAAATTPVSAEPMPVVQAAVTTVPEVDPPVSASKPRALREPKSPDTEAVVEASAQPAPAIPAPIPLATATPPDPGAAPRVDEMPASEPVAAETPLGVDVPASAATQPSATVPATDAPPPLSPEVSPPPEAPPQVAAVPYMFELPLSTRKELPAMKVTMHVYSSDSANRFAIIDGKRVGDGGVLGNDLNVVEIQRSAILIDFRGTRFLLPRLGR